MGESHEFDEANGRGESVAFIDDRFPRGHQNLSWLLLGLSSVCSFAFDDISIRK